MGFKKPSEAQDEGRDTVGGFLSELKADAGGWLAKLVDENEGGEVFVRISPKLAKGLKVGKILIAAGILKKNEDSGKRWMVAERVRTFDDMSDADIEKWEAMESRNDENKISRKQGIPFKERPKKRVFADDMADAFSQLRGKLKK